MTSRRSARPYVHEGGVLSRDPLTGYRSYRSSLWKFVEWKKVAWILVPALVMFVTNPGNGIFPCYISYASDEWIGRPGVTNYGLFSLEQTIEGVGLSGLLTRSDVLCPFYDQTIGPFCGSLADSMCHRKPFFPWEYPPYQRYFQRNDYSFDGEDFRDAVRDLISAMAVDRVHVFHRFICAILVGSAAWSFCCPRFPPLKYVLFGIGSDLIPVTAVNDLWTSVFSRSSSGTSLFRDLVYQNTFVYPTLVEFDRIVPKLRMTSWLVRPTGNETADFVVAVVLLVVVLGGGSNLVASRIVGGGRTMVGYSSVAAVALGYLVRNTSSGGGGLAGSIRATLGGRDLSLSYVHAFWSNVAWTFVAHPSDWFPRLVVWLVGGLAGSLYAELHLRRVELFVFRDLLGFFGLA